jgi:hypothetical protein
VLPGTVRPLRLDEQADWLGNEVHRSHEVDLGPEVLYRILSVLLRAHRQGAELRVGDARASLTEFTDRLGNLVEGGFASHRLFARLIGFLVAAVAVGISWTTDTAPAGLGGLAVFAVVFGVVSAVVALGVSRLLLPKPAALIIADDLSRQVWEGFTQGRTLDELVKLIVGTESIGPRRAPIAVIFDIIGRLRNEATYQAGFQ